LSSRSHIIVGGTAGMGKAAAIELLANGDRVALIGRDTTRAEAAAADLGALGFGSDDGGLDAAMNRALAALGGLDGLAVTAGPIAVQDDLLALSDVDWAECFDSQLMTVVRALRVAVPAMTARGGGSIVTVSAYSIRAPKAVLAHYAAMKAAIGVVTKTIAKSHGKDGIRANCIAPGAIATDSMDAMREAMGGLDNKGLWQVMRDKYGQKAGLDRIGEPHEVGELIAFLLSSKAAYLTGAMINVDGGTDF
jgi:NAD(P)-dependent dehydrogenase (short-subunit alcohol dehydrogenase family)